jgi:hypothetical protein
MMPSMPDVDTQQDLRVVFSKARKLSAGWETGRSVAIVTPGRLIMPVACPPANAVSPQMLEGVRRIVPENPKQQITVIADNNVVAASAFTAREANALIPFLGYLIGMAFEGHTVVVFEGHPSALASGCEGSALLLVDQAMVEYLQADWASVAALAMKSPNILIFGRDGSLAKIVPDGVPAISPTSPSRPVQEKRGWWPFGGGT